MLHPLTFYNYILEVDGAELRYEIKQMQNVQIVGNLTINLMLMSLYTCLTEDGIKIIDHSVGIISFPHTSVRSL